MKMFGFAIASFLATVPSYSCVPVPKENSEKLVKMHIVDLVSDMRTRSPEISLSAEGSVNSFYIRPSGEWNLYEDDKNLIIGTGFIDKRWERGYPFQTDIGLGAIITHNLYDGPNGQLDVGVEFDRVWEQGISSDDYHAGFNYRF